MCRIVQLLSLSTDSGREQPKTHNLAPPVKIAEYSHYSARGASPYHRSGSNCFFVVYRPCPPFHVASPSAKLRFCNVRLMLYLAGFTMTKAQREMGLLPCFMPPASVCPRPPTVVDCISLQERRTYSGASSPVPAHGNDGLSVVRSGPNLLSTVSSPSAGVSSEISPCSLFAIPQQIKSKARL